MKRRQDTYHHGDLKSELLKAARTRLARDGYEVLSLRELAREAGVAASAPYAHFAGRDALLTTLIKEGAQTLAGLFAAAAAVAGTPETKLAAVVRTYLDFSAREREMFRLLFTSPVPPSPVFADEVQTALDQFEILVAACLRSVDRTVVSSVALSCWSTMHGFALLRLHGRTHGALAAEGASSLIVDAVLRLTTPRT